MPTIRSEVIAYSVDGDDTQRIFDEFMSSAYDQDVLQTVVLPASPNRVPINMGPVTTAEMIYINSSAEITAYKNNGHDGWTVTGPFLVRGCEVTALHILAASGATLKIYIAGE